MDRLSSFSPAVQTAIIYFANPKKSLAEIGKEFGISKQAVHKRVKKAEEVLTQSQDKQRLNQASNTIKHLQNDIIKHKELITDLRRELILKSTLIYIFICFKERVLKFFPKFDVKRFEPYEKKYILDMLTKFQNIGGKLRVFCKAIQKSEETINKWLQAYEKYGMAGLKDKTTRPKNFSNKIPIWLKKQLLILFLRYPEWSAYRYYKYLKNNPATHYHIAMSTIEKIKNTHQIKSKAEKERIKKRWAFAQNYSVWTIDFTCILKTDKYKLQLLTVSDQRSRFWIEPILLLETSTKQVIDHLEELFITYGRPFMIKADNGQEFRLECKNDLNNLGIYLFNSPTYYGQFCGSHERIHRTLKGYISDFSVHKSLTKLVEEIKKFREEYNHEWPHEYLENKTPAEIFYSNEDFIPKEAEIIKPYTKDGELRLKFTDRNGLPARMSIPAINQKLMT